MKARPNLVAFVGLRVVSELLLCLVRVYLHAPHRQVSALQLHWLTSTDILQCTTSQSTHIWVQGFIVQYNGCASRL